MFYEIENFLCFTAARWTAENNGTIFKDVDMNFDCIVTGLTSSMNGNVDSRIKFEARFMIRELLVEYRSTKQNSACKNRLLSSRSLRYQLQYRVKLVSKQ